MWLFAGCAKSSPTISDDDNGGYASDADKIEWATDDVISISDAAGTLYNGDYMRVTHNTLGSCATVSTDTVDVPHTLTIRFGDEDCTCLDGKNRRGAIIVSYSGEYTDSNTVHTISFDNYYVNDNQLTGTIQVTRVDTTVTGNWYYDVLVNESLILNPDPLKSQSISWQGALVRKWVTGFTTPDRSDDAFSVGGSATLTRANGHTFNFNISTPLQINMSCDYAESGVVYVTGPNPPVRILNYGSTACDPYATVSISPNVYNITLTH
jgi:hypothetical protein